MQDNNKTNFDEENLEYLRSYLGGETVEDFLAFYEEKKRKGPKFKKCGTGNVFPYNNGSCKR